MAEFSASGFASYLFGTMAQDGRLTVQRIAEDAATIKTRDGQQFTVTVTASRPKQSYTPPAVTKRSKGSSDA